MVIKPLETLAGPTTNLESLDKNRQNLGYFNMIVWYGSVYVEVDGKAV